MGYTQHRALLPQAMYEERKEPRSCLPHRKHLYSHQEGELAILMVHLVADFLMKEYISGSDRSLAESNLLSNV